MSRNHRLHTTTMAFLANWLRRLSLMVYIAAHLRIVPNLLSWLTANLFGSEQRTSVGNRKTLAAVLDRFESTWTGARQYLWRRRVRSRPSNMATGSIAPPRSVSGWRRPVSSPRRSRRYIAASRFRAACELSTSGAYSRRRRLTGLLATRHPPQPSMRQARGLLRDGARNVDVGFARVVATA